MAPQTNIGSSTPITTNGTDFSKDLRRKIVNDAAAYIAELAREHGRNAAAAESMVRDAANFGAREAAAKNIVDVVSPTLPALLGRDRRHRHRAEGPDARTRPARPSTRCRCRSGSGRSTR